jgi:hypothetical protein
MVVNFIIWDLKSNFLTSSFRWSHLFLNFFDIAQVAIIHKEYLAKIWQYSKYESKKNRKHPFMYVVAS